LLQLTHHFRGDNHNEKAQNLVQEMVLLVKPLARDNHNEKRQNCTAVAVRNRKKTAQATAQQEQRRNAAMLNKKREFVPKLKGSAT